MVPAGQLIPLDAIDIGERERPLDEAHAQFIAASIEQVGLHSMIVVRPVENRLQLVIGHHRLRAAEILGWTEIPGVIVVMSDAEAKLAEIDENLARRENTKLDTALSLAKRKAVYEQLHPETAHGRAKKDKLQNSATLPPRFTTEVADKVGLGERTVQNLLQIAKAIDPEAVAHLHGTAWADNESALLKLANETPQRQRALAMHHRDGARTLDEARTRAGYQDVPLPEETNPQASILANLMQFWLRADGETRAEFLAEIKLADEVAAAKPARKGKAK